MWLVTHERTRTIQTLRAVLSQVRGSKDAPAFDEAVGRLAHLGNAAIPALLKAMRAETHVRARLALAKSLPAYGRAAWEPLLAAARVDKGLDFGWSVAWAMGGFTSLLGAEDFIAALRHPIVHVRWSAAVALEQFADERAIGPLVAALAEDGPATLRHPKELYPTNYHEKVRLRAALALRHIGTPAMPALLIALESANPLVRTGAAWALTDLGNVYSFEPLVVAMHDPDVEVRLAVSQAITSLAPVLRDDQRMTALPLLLDSLQERDERLRSAAARGLAALGMLALDPLRERAGRHEATPTAAVVQVAAVHALELMLDRQPPIPELARHVVPLFIEVLGTTNTLAAARRIAAEALGKAGDERAVAPLLAALGGDTDIEVRIAAAESARALGDQSALPALTNALAVADATLLRAGDEASEADEELQSILQRAIQTLENR